MYVKQIFLSWKRIIPVWLLISILKQESIIKQKEPSIMLLSGAGFTKSLQDEVSKYGICLTNVMPGMMKTDMFNKMNIQKNMENGIDTKEVARLIKFIVDTPSDVMIPEVGIKNINN